MDTYLEFLYSNQGLFKDLLLMKLDLLLKNNNNKIKYLLLRLI